LIQKKTKKSLSMGFFSFWNKVWVSRYHGDFRNDKFQE